MAGTELIISVSGLRGVVGRSLTAQVARDYALAFGVEHGGQRVVIGRDSRTHGEMLYYAAVSGLLEAGCEPVLAGCVATPTCGVLVQATGAAGGLMVTASHNPPPWNGIKLFDHTGRVLSGGAGEEVSLRYRSAQVRPVEWDRVARPVPEPDPHAVHLERVLALVDVAAIRRRRFRVLLDSNHGAGGVLGRRLLEALGCEVVGWGLEPSGQFSHAPEPIPEHLQEVAEEAKRHGVDIGFAQDPDADRLVLIDERGRVLSEEYTLAVVADAYFLDHSGSLVINLSTSRLSEEAARARGATVFRAPVGEANVVDEARRVGATLAGEGNGGIIHGDVVWVRDSFTGMALVLQALARAEEPLSALVARLPQWHMTKLKLPLGRAELEARLDRLRTAFPQAHADHRDGLRLEAEDWWLHVRGSNTEPIARLIVEARTPELLEQRLTRALELLA